MENKIFKTQVKRKLSLVLAIVMVITMFQGSFEGLMPEAYAAPMTIQSDDMQITVTSDPSPIIQMYSKDDNGAWTLSYQFGSSHFLTSVTGKAVPSGAEGVDDPADPDFWKQPEIIFDNTSGSYVRSGNILNATDVSSTQQGQLFFNTPTIETRNSYGSPFGDDTIVLQGWAPGFGNGVRIWVTATFSIRMNAVTGDYDMGRYIVKAENRSDNDEAYVYGSSWNIDTWIGSTTSVPKPPGWDDSVLGPHSGNGDYADFEGPGINPFSIRDISVGFPTPSTGPWVGGYNSLGETKYLFAGDNNIYQNSVPNFLYAVHPGDALRKQDRFTAAIYPGMSTNNDGMYLGEQFERPDYAAVDYYSNLAQRYYYYKNLLGSPKSSSRDSGHMVRYNPRLLLPGKTLYFGYDYGQGEAGQSALLDAPTLAGDMPVTNITKNDTGTEYVNEYSVLAKYAYGELAAIAYTGAYVELRFDDRYLEASDEMISSAIWSDESASSTEPNIAIWHYNIGNFNPGTAETQLNPNIKLIPKNVYEATDPSGYDGVKTDVSAKLVLHNYYPDDPDTISFTNTVSIPRLNSATISGSVWRDVNNNGTFDSFEGQAGKAFKLKKNGSEAASATSASTGDVIFADVQILNDEDYSVEINLEDGSLYGIKDIKVKVNGSDITMPIESSSNHEIFDYMRIGADASGEKTLDFKINEDYSDQVRIKFETELAENAELSLIPYKYPDSSAYVEGGTAKVSTNGTETPPIEINEVPKNIRVSKGATVNIKYTTPDGYRTTTGSKVYEQTMTNTQTDTVYIPLIAGDVAFTGVKRGTEDMPFGGNNIDIPKKADLDVQSYGQEHTLSIDVWSTENGGLMDEQDIDRIGMFTWEVVSDGGILDYVVGSQKITNDGKIKIKSGQTGQAEVKVTLNGTLASDTMIIETTGGTGGLTEYESFIIKPAESTVAMGGETTLKVIGVDSNGQETELKNTIVEIVPVDSIVTIRKSTANDKEFIAEGVNTGYTELKVMYKGVESSSNPAAHILVTRYNITQNTKLEIVPKPIEITGIGQEANVSYKLVHSTAQSETIPAEAVEASIDANRPGIATYQPGKVISSGTGWTNLNAELKADTNKTATSMVTCHAGGVGQGNTYLELREVAPEKHGLIEKDTTATYDIILVSDTGETPVARSLVDLVLQNGKISFDNIGATSTQVGIKGVQEGTTKLTATYNGYTASKDILVYKNGYTPESNLVIQPEKTVIFTGNEATFSVKLKVRNAGDTILYELPQGMYTGSTGNNATAVKVTGTENKVKGIAKGETDYTATMTGTNYSGNADILVLNTGTKIKIDPNPIWIEKDGNVNVTYSLVNSSGQAETIPSGVELTDYVTAKIQDSTKAEFNNGNIENIKGNDIGITKLTASLINTNVKDEATIYVRNTNASAAIRFEPTNLNLTIGQSGNSKLVLLDEHADPAGDIDFAHVNTTVTSGADKINTTLPTSGTNIEVTGASEGSAVIGAVIPGTSMSAALDIHVTFDAAGLGNRGIIAEPKIIQLWTNETAEIIVKDEETGVEIDTSKLNNALENGDNTVTEENGRFVVKNPGNTGLNTIEITLRGTNKKVAIQIINLGGNKQTDKLKLKLEPDPVQVVKDSSKNVKPTLYIMRNNTEIGHIDLTEKYVKVKKSATNLGGDIAVSLESNPDGAVKVVGKQSGGAQYKVTYVLNDEVYADGKAFVLDDDVSNISSFEFVPDIAVLDVGDVMGLEGKIIYNDGHAQIITSAQLPYAVKEITSNHPSIATVNEYGVVRGIQESLNTEALINGKLVAEDTLEGTSRILVIDFADADFSIYPDPAVVTIDGSNIPLEFRVNEISISNDFVKYIPSNSKINIVNDSEVKGVEKGAATVTGHLKETNISAIGKVIVVGSEGITGLKITPNPVIVEEGRYKEISAVLVSGNETISIPISSLTVESQNPHCTVNTDNGTVKGTGIGYDFVEFSYPTDSSSVKDSVLVIVHGNGNQEISIDEHEYRKLTAATTSTAVSATVDMNGETESTVLWVIDDGDAKVAFFDEGLTEAVYYDSDSPVTNSNTNIYWNPTNVRPGQLKAYVLESGDYDEASLIPKTLTISRIKFKPQSVYMYLDEYKTLDEMADFDITIETVDLDEISASLRDFKIVEGGTGSTATAEITGRDAEGNTLSFDSTQQKIYGRSVGPEELRLEYKYASNASSHRRDVTVHVKDYAPVGIVYFDEEGATLLRTIYLKVGESIIITPKYEMNKEGVYAEIPAADNVTWTLGNNVRVEKRDEGGITKLVLTGKAPDSDVLRGEITVGSDNITGNILVDIRSGSDTVRTDPHTIVVEVTSGTQSGGNGSLLGSTYFKMEQAVANDNLKAAVTNPNTGEFETGTFQLNHGEITVYESGDYVYTANPGLSVGEYEETLNYKMTAPSGDFDIDDITINITVTDNGGGTPSGTTYKVSGVVKDSTTYNPIAGATVELICTESQIQYTTNANGEYEFLNVPPKNYTIKVSATDYNTKSETISVSNDDVTNHIIYLVKTDNGSSGNGGGSGGSGGSGGGNGGSGSGGGYNAGDGNTTNPSGNTGDGSTGTGNANGGKLKPELNKDDHFAYLIGYENGTFRPDNNMTRAEVIVMFSRLLTDKMDMNKTYENSFNDVNSTDWYANYIGFMEAYGIVQGYNDGSFKPNNPVTRAEFATISSRFNELTEGSKEFKDVPASHWAHDYVSLAEEKGWVSGYPDGTFRPEQRITRAEVVTVVNRMLERSAENLDKTYIDENITGIDKFSDVSTKHWAYYEILEASTDHNFEKSDDNVESWTSLK